MLNRKLIVAILAVVALAGFLIMKGRDAVRAKKQPRTPVAGKTVEAPKTEPTQVEAPPVEAPPVEEKVLSHLSPEVQDDQNKPNKELAKKDRENMKATGLRSDDFRKKLEEQRAKQKPPVPADGMTPEKLNKMSVTEIMASKEQARTLGAARGQREAEKLHSMRKTVDRPPIPVSHEFSGSAGRGSMPPNATPVSKPARQIPKP